MKLVDNDIIDYDLDKYPFPAWVKAQIEDAGYDASDLTRLHETIPLTEVSTVLRRVIRATGGEDFRNMARTYVEEVLEPYLDAELALQRFTNLRILVPDKPAMCIHFHNGVWFGHGLGETTSWMPMCQTAGNGSLWVCTLEASRRLAAKALAERWDHQTMQKNFLAEAEAVAMDPGQALLFQQEGLHGNALVNDTGRTRVSFDMRVAAKGVALGRKMVGGYFEPIRPSRPAPATPIPEGEQRIVFGYVNNNTQTTRGIPIVLQRLMMRDYCKPLNLVYTYEHLEIEPMEECPILKHMLEVSKPEEVVLYSIFALPDDPDMRKPILDAAVRNRIVLHFANEDLSMRTEEDRQYIDQLLGFAPHVTFAESAFVKSDPAEIEALARAGSSS